MARTTELKLAMVDPAKCISKSTSHPLPMQHSPLAQLLAVVEDQRFKTPLKCNERSNVLCHELSSDIKVHLVNSAGCKGNGSGWRCHGRMARNFVYSPFAIRQALGLLYLSKDNVTDQQLESALQLTGLRQEEIISLLGEAREKAARERLTITNRIYLSPDYNASPNITQLGGNLGMEVKNMTFSSDQSAANEIKKWLNRWIGKAGKNLFGKNDISQTTQVVAVQGMSYSCVWKNREKALTNRTFTLLRQNRKPFVYTVEMMYTEAPMQFFNNDQVRGVVVPFNNSDMEMLVLLPRPKYSTQQIMFSLDTILKIKLRMSKKTHLFLPKFKVSESVDLNMALKALGIENLFTNGVRRSNAANFKQYNSLDADQNRVLITIDVGDDFDDRVVYVNRGFVFVIRDKSNIYMIGRMDATGAPETDADFPPTQRYHKDIDGSPLSVGCSAGLGMHGIKDVKSGTRCRWSPELQYTALISG
ncbi:GM14890 [Drosophila sechellia]|uniref:GM14890 n=1 Tax=Drosophila sechellia TaxID=7238 RepID=B4IG00_DROSE|nr:GM14890 [Drosophila sechellia]